MTDEAIMTVLADRIVNGSARGTDEIVWRLILYSTPDLSRAALRSHRTRRDIVDQYEYMLARWERGLPIDGDGNAYRQVTCQSCGSIQVVRNDYVRTHDWPPMCRSLCQGSGAPAP